MDNSNNNNNTHPSKIVCMYVYVSYCCHSDESVKEVNPSTQNGTASHGSHGNSSKEPPSSVPVYHVTFPGTFIEV